MVDQRVAAEKQNGVGTPYIPPMTRRLKCRIDPEQSPYTCMLPEHKPVRRGREMIDLLAVEEPKPKPAKIRAVSYEAAIDQLFKRMRSSSSALTQQAVSTPRGPVPNERRRRRLRVRRKRPGRRGAATSVINSRRRISVPKLRRQHCIR